jgi:hypothetical protein
MCKKEEYDTGDITFKWKNKGSIEGIVNKWIISFMNGDDKITDDMEITKDSRPDLFRNFTNNQVQILGGYTFTSYPSDGLTVKLYYDEKKTDNLLIEKNIKFDQTKLTVGRGFLDKKERNDLTFQQLTEATVNTYKLYEYAFIMNKLSHKGMTTYSNYGLEIQWIKVDGVLLTSQNNNDDIYIKIDKQPGKDLDNMFKEDNSFAQWIKKSVNAIDGVEFDDRVFTISKKNNKIEKIEISYYKPIYAPGWKILENSKIMIEESENRGSGTSPENVTYTYTIPKTPIPLDDTVSENWFEWTGNTTGEGYFDASVMENNWVNVNYKTGLDVSLKGATIQKGLTLEQCKSLCEKEDECKSLEFTEESGDVETSCALAKVRPIEDNTTNTELESKIWIRPDPPPPPPAPPAIDADASPDTAWKKYEGTKFEGNTIVGTWAETLLGKFENATLDKCKYECETNPQCESFNYHTQEPDNRNNCYTFSTKPIPHGQTASNIKGPHPHNSYLDWDIYEQTSDKIVSESGLGLPNKVYMKGGKGWCALDSTKFKCNSTEKWRKQFELFNNGDGTYSFKRGSYCKDFVNNIFCTDATITDNSKFKIISNVDGTYSIKPINSSRGYCSGINDGNNYKCISDTIGDLEKFNFYDVDTGEVVSSPTSSTAPPPPPPPPPPSITEIPTGEKVYIKGGNKGKYCRADRNNKVYCNTTTNANGFDESSNFIFNKNSDGTYSFKNSDSGKYCTDLANYIQCSNTMIRDWQKFKIINNSDGTYSLMGNGGKGPAADGGLNWKYCKDNQYQIKCKESSIGGLEKFEIGKV